MSTNSSGDVVNTSQTGLPFVSKVSISGNYATNSFGHMATSILPIFVHGPQCVVLSAFYYYLHIAAVYTRHWICCSILRIYLYFLCITFQRRKRSFRYRRSPKERVNVWSLRYIHTLLMCSHYTQEYWVFHFGWRINALWGEVTTLFLLVVWSIVCSTYLYRKSWYLCRAARLPP